MAMNSNPQYPLLHSTILCPPQVLELNKLIAKGCGLMPFLYLNITCSPRQVRIQGICISLSHSPWSRNFWGKRIWAGPDAFTPPSQK